MSERYNNPENFSQPAIESEKQFSYEIMADPTERKELLKRMTEFTKSTIEQKVDALVFLDMSARPLAHLYTEIFRKLNTEKEEKLKMPIINFFHINSESKEYKHYNAFFADTSDIHFPEVDGFGRKSDEIQSYNRDAPASLGKKFKSLFKQTEHYEKLRNNEIGKREMNDIIERMLSEMQAAEHERIMSTYKTLARLPEGAKVTIVDDIEFSQDDDYSPSTIGMARRFFKKTFPKLEIDTFALSTPVNNFDKYGDWEEQRETLFHKEGYIHAAPWEPKNYVPSESTKEEMKISPVLPSPNNLTSIPLRELKSLANEVKDKYHSHSSHFSETLDLPMILGGLLDSIQNGTIEDVDEAINYVNEKSKQLRQEFKHLVETGE